MIFRQARGKGVTLSTVDALLAALAIENNATLFAPDNDLNRLWLTGLRLHWPTLGDRVNGSNSSNSGRA